MEIIELYYDKHLSDNPEIEHEIRTSMEMGLDILVKGPTGCGKTVLASEISHRILEDEKMFEEDQSKIILTCPNVIQNKQNESSPLVRAKSFTKGEKLEGKRFISAVYDKSYVATEEGDKVHLIVDEAHKMIYDETYRAKALEQVGMCSDKAFSVTHITATPRVLLDGIFRYDKYIICKPKDEVKNYNIEDFKLIAMPNKDRIATLINFLKERCEKKSIGTTILCRINSIQEIKNVIDKLHKYNPNIKTQKIISKEKELNPVFNSIVENGSVGTDYDIVFVTSLLDAGTSIYDKNIEVIYHSRTAHDILLDDIEQFFARARTKIKNGFLTCSSEEVDEKTKTLKQIKSKNNKQREKILKSFDNLIDAMKGVNATKQEVINTIETRLNFEFEETKTNYGCIQFDEDKLECFINKRLAEGYDFREYDRQFYKDPKKLLSELKGKIKADKMSIMYYSNVDKDIKDSISQDKMEKEEKAKDMQDKAKKILQNKDIAESLLFAELIQSNDLCLDFADEEIRESLEFLQEEETLLESIKDLMEIGMELDQATNIVAKAKKTKDIKIAKMTYQAILLNTKKRYSIIDDNFTRMHKIIREEIKPIEKRQGRVTDAIIEKIYLRLLEEGILEKRKKPKNKILELINLIYNTSKIKNEKNSLKISSIKTNIQTLK